MLSILLLLLIMETSTHIQHSNYNRFLFYVYEMQIIDSNFLTGLLPM